MLSKISIKRPVTTVMILLIVMLGGIVSMFSLNLDLMPSIDVPIAIISTTYVGAGPEEVETLITEPIEESMGTVANVDTISSTSSANSSMVIVQFVDGTDIDMAAIDMREKIDLVKSTLPDDANEPMVIKMDINSMSAIMVGVTSENLDLDELNTLLEDNVKGQIERIEGVASVELIGGHTQEVQIIINPEKMQGYGITTSQVSQILKAENTNYPTGKITQGDVKLQIRNEGEFKSLDEIRDMPITTATGAIVHVSDFAEVVLTNAENESYAQIDGRDAVVLYIQKQSNANTVDISDKVNVQIAKVQEKYPDLHISMVSDTADYIKTSINNVISTAVQAAIMAVVVLFIFLRDPKTSSIIGISIPTSVVATFALMYLNGMTMNIISMGGITLGIGMLVDNSVVVMDTIFRHWKEGEDPKTAAENGSKEVSLSIAASTFTTVAVFLPLMFVTGTIGQMFRDLSLTITFALGASLIVALTFVPMACSRTLMTRERKADEIATGKRKSKRGPVTLFLDKWGAMIDKLDGIYRKVLSWALWHKKRVVAMVLVIFLATLALVPIIGIDLMPSMDQGSATITIDMPKGSILEATTAVTDEVLAAVDDIEETKEYFVMVGGGMMSSGTDSATVMLNFVDKKERKRSTDEICDEIRKRLENIPGADITVSASSSAMGSYSSTGVTIQLNGDDTDTLRDIGEDFKRLLAEVPGTMDITSSSEESVPEANVVVNRKKAAQYGLNSGTLAGYISTAVTGSVASQYRYNGTEIDIRIKQAKDQVQFINDLKNIMITAPSGVSVPLSEVADITIKDSATSITRKNQHQYITVSASVSGRDINSVSKDVQEKIDDYIFPEGYSYEFTGTLEDMQETYSSLGLVFLVALLLVYMIMAAQFESLIHPFIVMFSVPIAITGAILGLFVTGKTITVTAFMGFIILVGTVVNNAIVLIDYTRQLRERGFDCNDALLEAGPTRLRPILMTTLTTVLGLLPMALAMGEGTEMQQPMAISIIFGMTLSTVVTLVFIPVLYAIVEKLRIMNLKKQIEKRRRRDEAQMNS